MMSPSDDNNVSTLRPSCNKRTRTLLVALHDVTPAHIDRLERAERCLTRWGVPSATYLLVPDFHARAPANEDAFVEWCRAARPFGVHWFLHGYLHREDARASNRAIGPLSEWLARRFLTAGEAEFLSLRGVRLERRLKAGIERFCECLGQPPSGFVAPAWLYNDELLPALRRLNVAFTESHFHVFDLRTNHAIGAPVITWATRSALHRAGSRVAAAMERCLWTRWRTVRIALHPTDFDHPRTIDSIERCLNAMQRGHRVATYEQAFRLR